MLAYSTLGFFKVFITPVSSGGHLNPAVSLGVVLSGGMHIVRLIPYWIAQLCGGLVGAGLAKVSNPFISA